MDRINQAKHLYSLDGLTHLKTYEDCVKQMGISGFTFWIGQQSKQLKWQTLNGPEKLIVFSNIDIPATFPDLEHKAEIQNLLEEFLKIHKMFSVKPADVQSNTTSEFETASRGFVNTFVSIYPAKHVTPYMHCMMNHVDEFMEIHGSILPFTQQVLEKYNDIMTKTIFDQHHTTMSKASLKNKIT